MGGTAVPELNYVGFEDGTRRMMLVVLEGWSLLSMITDPA